MSANAPRPQRHELNCSWSNSGKKRARRVTFPEGSARYPSRVRRVWRAAFFAWSIAGVAGCAAISGLDQIRESPCILDCTDASGGDDTGGDNDATSPTRRDSDSPPSSQDATTGTGSSGDDGRDATPDGFGRSDGGALDGSAHPVDAQADCRDGEISASDAQADARDAESGGSRDAQADAKHGDASAGADAPCGPLDTVTNCGACGATCASTSTSQGVAMASCTGNSCQYQCKATYLDCNASVAPDTDGCECATNGSISARCCPDNACPVEHTTGFATGPSGQDQTFYDCETSVSMQVAMDACTAYSGRAAYCAQGGCNGSPDLVVCNWKAPISQDRVCWDYQGSLAGWAVDSAVTFTCPWIPDAGPGQVSFH
jgi:hypothetical protein